MVKLRLDECFPRQPLTEMINLARSKIFRPDRLDDHLARQQRVAAEVELPHAPFAKLADDLVIADGASNHIAPDGNAHAEKIGSSGLPLLFNQSSGLASIRVSVAPLLGHPHPERPFFDRERSCASLFPLLQGRREITEIPAENGAGSLPGRDGPVPDSSPSGPDPQFGGHSG